MKTVEIPKAFIEQKAKIVSNIFEERVLDAIILATWYNGYGSVLIRSVRSKIEKIVGTIPYEEFNNALNKFKENKFIDIKGKKIHINPPDMFLKDKDKQSKELNKAFKDVVEHWNTKDSLMSHNIATVSPYKAKIQGFISKIGQENIEKAIDAYDTIIGSDDYWYTYKWTLIDFLKKGLSKFMPTDGYDPYVNYRRKKAKFKPKKRSRYDEF